MFQNDLKAQVGLFSGAEIKVVLHATESEDKILRSINEVLSVPPDRFTIECFEGHWGNKLCLMTATLSSPEANTLAIKVVSLLTVIDISELANSFPKYMDEKGSLYIRLDKQRICRGKLSLSASDSIRIRFKPVRRYQPVDSIIQSYKRRLLSLKE
jgi:RNA binding exosome subunit